MTTKDAMAALDNLDEARTLGVDPLSEDLATLRAFVTEMGPVREVLELDCDILHLRHPGEWCAVNEKMRGTGPTYAAACTAALESLKP